jgi:hypothetical protein
MVVRTFLSNINLEIILLSVDDKCSWTSESYDYKNDLVSYRIYNYHCWEPFQTEITVELFHKLKNKTFIDIGAHIGYYSLFALFHNFNVKAYEQNYDIFQILHSNLSSFSNAKTFNEFVTSKNSIIDENQQIGLIKIDVEGNEPSIVYGLEPHLKNNQIEALIIEISPKFKPVAEWIDLINYLHSFGYKSYDIGLSPIRVLESDTHHLDSLSLFDTNTLYSIIQTNLLFLKN